MEIMDASYNYVPYTSVTNEVQLFDSSSDYKVEMATADPAQDLKTQIMRIKATVGVNSIYINFDVEWLDNCYFLEPELEPFSDFFYYSKVLEGTSQIIANKNLKYANTAFPNKDCGPISWVAMWPTEKIIHDFVTFLNGDFTINPVLPEHFGAYKLGVIIVQSRYNRPLIRDYIWLQVGKCVPEQIVPPYDLFRQVVHVIGTQKLKVQFADFEKIQPCFDTLVYTVADSDGNSLDSEMKVSIVIEGSKNFLVVETVDLKLANTYKLQIIASYPNSEAKNQEKAAFDLRLLKPEYDGSKIKDPLVPEDENLVDGPLTPDFQYQVPPGQDIVVVLGPASAFMQYDPITGLIQIIDGVDLRQHQGDFRVIVIINGKEHYINLSNWFEDDTQKVNETAIAIELDDPDKTWLKPRVKYIDTLGELTLLWDKPMVLPQNMTLFGEQIFNETKTVDIYSGLEVTKPALEFTLVISFTHEMQNMTMTTEFVRWESDREMIFQLTYSDTLAISMEIPADLVNITFWDQDLFKSQSGLRVTRQHSIDKQIPPQAEDDELAKTINVIAYIFLSLIIFAGIVGCLMQVLMGLSLSLLWSLLHSLQLIIHLPIFIVQFPGYAFLFYIVLAYLVKFDLIETEDQVFDWFAIDPAEEAYAPEYVRLLYFQQNWLYNSGFNVIICVGMALCYGISKILPLCNSRYPKVEKISKKLDDRLYWNAILRMILELSLELFIISIMDVSRANFDTYGYIISFSLALLSLSAIVGVLILSRAYLSQNYELLKEKAWRETFDSIYMNLNLKSKVHALFFTEWFLIRRFIYAATAFYGIGNYWIQFQILFNSSLFTLYIYAHYRPFDSLYTMRIEIINECFLLMILYHTTFFTYVIPDHQVRSNLGVSCVVWTCLCISFQLVIFSRGVTHIWKLRLQRRFNRQKMEKVKKMRALGQSMMQNNHNVDYEQLQRQMVAVEVKAQQTNYLLNPFASALQSKINPQANMLLDISADSGSQPQDRQKQTSKPSLSNLNQKNLPTPATVQRSMLIEEEKKEPKGGPMQLERKGLGVQNRPGFNIDLQMFDDRVGQVVMKDLTKMWYGDKAGSKPMMNIMQNSSANTALASPARQHDPHLFDLSGLESSSPQVKKQNINIMESQKKNAYDDLPAGIGKTIHIDLM